MMLLICFYIILCYLLQNAELYLDKPWYHNAHYTSHIAKDKMGKKERLTIVTIAKELLSEARYKARLVHDIRQEHHYSLSYEIGLIMGKIRERYKRMMEIYHTVIVRRKGKFTLLPPGHKWRVYTVYYIRHLENIRMLQLEIDHLVEMIENGRQESLEDELKNKIQIDLFNFPQTFRRMANSTNLTNLTFLNNQNQNGRRKTIDSFNLSDNSSITVQNVGDNKMIFLNETRKFPANRPRQVQTTTSTLTYPSTFETTVRDETHKVTERYLTQQDIKRRYRQKFYAEQRHLNWTIDDEFGF